MKLTPFGVLKDNIAANSQGIFTPMSEWKSDVATYKSILENWLEQVEDSIWPAWNGTKWVGGAKIKKEKNAKEELQIAVNLYHGANGVEDILDTIPNAPMLSDGIVRDHKWHFKVEDAVLFHTFYAEEKLPNEIKNTFEYQAQKTGVANFLVYEPTFDHDRFIELFFGALRTVNPQVFDIKVRFQRPRPWTAAALLGVDNFRWTTASGFIHTGQHPSLLSGHCIQGIMCCCSVLDKLIDAGELNEDRKLAIQQYMVDWGDRRVFAGVHYMTDNIASWTLAIRLIPHIFKNSAQVLEFADEAITQKSRVYQDILANFSEKNAAKKMLLEQFSKPASTA